jgi:lactate dehydrogenase-like 2-hydroxyacid dehydrogenase
MAKHKVLQVGQLSADGTRDLNAEFDVTVLPSDPAERSKVAAERGSEWTAIASNGHAPVDKALLDAMPNLKLIASPSAGIEGIDVASAKARDIKVTNSSAVLADECADVAVSLVLGLTRQTLEADRYVREGKWLSGPFPLGRAIKGLKIGIYGLGHIGKAIARRLEVMGAVLSYHGRSSQHGVAYNYVPTLRDLALSNDMLIVAVPGGPETARTVDADIIEAIGPEGWLVNISRGSVVDEDALIAALKADRLKGFASDVFAKEPNVPAELIADRRTVLLPHYGSGTVQTRRAMVDTMLESLRRHFAA